MRRLHSTAALVATLIAIGCGGGTGFGPPPPIVGTSDGGSGISGTTGTSDTGTSGTTTSGSTTSGTTTSGTSGTTSGTGAAGSTGTSGTSGTTGTTTGTPAGPALTITARVPSGTPGIAAALGPIDRALRLFSSPALAQSGLVALPGANVTLSFADGRSGSTATTDSNGVANFGFLTTGTYRAHVEKATGNSTVQLEILLRLQTGTPLAVEANPTSTSIAATGLQMVSGVNITGLDVPALSNLTDKPTFPPLLTSVNQALQAGQPIFNRTTGAIVQPAVANASQAASTSIAVVTALFPTPNQFNVPRTSLPLAVGFNLPMEQSSLPPHNANWTLTKQEGGVSTVINATNASQFGQWTYSDSARTVGNVSLPARTLAFTLSGTLPPDTQEQFVLSLRDLPRSQSGLSLASSNPIQSFQTYAFRTSP